jgi:hypothetical protein
MTSSIVAMMSKNPDARGGTDSDALASAPLGGGSVVMVGGHPSACRARARRMRAAGVGRTGRPSASSAGSRRRQSADA